tara:strand:- start:24 stop:596 length:573 start_codon:yes stop_codon:yes gene_type:complete
MSGGWNLKLDEVHHSAWQFDVFSKKECLKIIEYAKKQKSQKAITDDNTPNIRKYTNIYWLSQAQEINWVFEKITNVVLNLNEQFFKFNIFALNEPLQFTHYFKKGACYKKHVDRTYNRPVRKLSVSVQLTDSFSYKGCELLLHNETTPTKCKKEIGSLTIFPSYTLHEVTELQQGERFALVTWVTGNSFQ